MSKISKEEALAIQAHRKKIEQDKANGIIHVLYTPFIKEIKRDREAHFFEYICIDYCCHCTGRNISERERSITLEQIETNLFESLTPDVIEQLRTLGRDKINEQIHKYDHLLYQDDVRLQRLTYIANKLFIVVGLNNKTE